MKAVLCKSYGSAENLTLEDVSEPELKPGQVIVDVRASALNFPDVLMIEGKYQSQPEFPFSPGGEIAGVVSAVAFDVDEWKVGDAVFGGSGHGGVAEKLAISAKSLKPKPACVRFTCHKATHLGVLPPGGNS